jgi:hypothetical protein
MLNTFEPSTTPTLRSPNPRISADIADAISGESAPSATAIPSTAGVSLSRTPSRSI